LRTKHGLIDFDDVYVKPNVWRQLGLSCRWLDGTVRQQWVGHLPFARRATVNGGFSVRRTGSIDPMQPSSFEESSHSTC
jgi:hypothetical protein